MESQSHNLVSGFPSITCHPRSCNFCCSSGTVLDLLWQYWTISEKRRAKADRETSCLPLERLLSRMEVLGRITGAGVDEDIRDMLRGVDVDTCENNEDMVH